MGMVDVHVWKTPQRAEGDMISNSTLSQGTYWIKALYNREDENDQDGYNIVSRP
jgi:hypothetical protein